MKRLFKVLVVLSLTVMILMNMASCKSVLDKTPYLDGPTTSNEVTSDLGDQTTPEETPVVTDEPTTEPATEPVTVPGTDPEVTEPEVTEPEVTDPEVTEPEVTEPTTEPEVTDPEVTDPEVTEPEVTEPEVTEPTTEPEVTEPTTEPEVTEPTTEPEVDPDLPEPVENKVTVSIADYATENGWQNETKYLSIIADKNITITAATSKNNTYTGKYYTNGNDWRIYQTDGGSITIAAADGKTIVSVKIIYKSQNTGTLLQGETPIKSGDIVSVNGNSVTLSVGNTGTATNGQARISSIEIIYLGEAETPSCQHTGAEAVRENEVGATCSTEGSYESVVYCSKCGDELSRETKTIGRLDHTPAEAVKENEVGATCSTEGNYDLVIKCSECGYEISRETKTTEKLNHTPATAVKENEVEATCIAAGSYDLVVKCSVCGYEISRESKTTEKAEHVMSGWDIVKDSTCKEKGTKTRECTVCDYEETVDIPTADHNYNDDDICVDCGSVNDGHQHTYESVVTPPTCTAEGYTTHTCACGDSYVDSKVPNTHTPAEAVKENEVGATCSKEGSYESVVYCSVCTEQISRETKTIDKLAHTMGAWAVTTDPTCTTKGVETSKCENCNHFETRDVDTIAHTPAEAVRENEVPATCSKEGSYDLVVYCSVCKTKEISRETKAIDKLEHTGYEADYKCDVCSTIVPPQADSALTIAQAITLSKLYSSETPTTGKYYLTGIITEIYNTTFGNMYITDGTNTIIVYGVYSETGDTRYDAMTVKPAVGDKITVYGVLGQHSGKAQMIDGWMTELCKHTYTETERVNATCTTPGSVTELCSECGHSKTTSLPVIAHNYENGQCTACEKVETIVTDATISFADKTNRLDYSTSQQIWAQNGITVTNVKGNAQSNIGDYSNPARFYKGTSVTIAFPGMTKIVIKATSSYVDGWKDTVDGATITVDGTTVTIVFAKPTDSITLTMGAQARASSITVYSEVEKCLHKETVVENAADATCTTDGYTGDTVCSKCGETVNEGTTIPATNHTPAEAVRENEVPATCAKEGSYDSVVYCSVCTEQISRETITTEKLDHTPAQAVKENEVPATCAKEGSYDSVVYCSVCTEQLSRETITVDKPDHTPAQAVKENEVPASCTKEGSYDSVVYCSVCTEQISRKTETVGKLNHTPAEAVKENEVPASCTKEGSYDSVVYCSVCTEQISRKTETVGKLNHTPAQAVVENEVDATCTKEGSYDSVIYCSVCTEQLSRETITTDKAEHVYKETVITPSTCVVNGEKLIECENCDYSQTATMSLVDHQFNENKVCVVCNATDTGHVHAFTINVTVVEAPTCTETGTNSGTCLCGVSGTVEVSKLGHAYVDHEAQAPTCTNKGWEAYQTCSRCDYSTKQDIPATDHAYIDHEAQAPTCTDKGWEAYQTCENCDYTSYVEIPATGHTEVKEYKFIDGVLYHVDTCGCVETRETVEADENGIEVATENDINEVLKAGYNVVLTANIKLTSAIEIEGKEVVINLGGYTITADWVDENGVVEVLWAKGTGTVVTINGEGSMKSGTGSGTNSVVSSTDGAIVNINGGYYYSASYGAVIATTRNGVVNIYGGKFEAAETWKGTWYVLDIDETIDAKYFGEINVFGGEFVNYDPVNNTNDGKALANKVADGYHSIYDEETNSYTVSQHNYNKVVTAPNCEDGGYTTNTCVCGDTYVDSYTDALDHSFTNYVSNKDATCTEDGTQTAKCDRCEETKTIADEGSALDHSFTNYVSNKDATCTEDGTKTAKCDRCEETKTVTDEGSKLGHNFVDDECDRDGCHANQVIKEEKFEFGANGSTSHYDGTELKEDTSYTVGDYTLTLSGMSKVYGSARDEKGNSCLKLGTGSAAGKFSFTVPNNVTKVIIYIAGYKAETAKISVNNKNHTISSQSNAGNYTAIEVDTTSTKTVTLTTLSGGYRAMVNAIVFSSVSEYDCDHQYNEVTKDATCTVDGSITRTCTECEKVKGEVIPATGHTYGEGAVTNPTCTEDGYTTYTCTNNCDHSYTDNTVGATGHTYGEGVVTPPTCIDEGYTTYTCANNCGYSYTADTTEATGEHTFADGKCTVCDALDHVHTYEKVVTAPTCTEKGYTTYTCDCGDSRVADEVPETGHTDGEAVVENEVAAGCANNGSYDLVVKCSECGYEISRETVTVDATGHTFVCGACDCGQKLSVETTTSMNIYANKGTTGTNTISWTSNGITFTNTKGSTAIRTSDSDHYRVYANSSVTITGQNITKVVITCQSSYVLDLSSLENATITTNGTAVTITLKEAADSITFKGSAQWRLSKIEVTCVANYSMSDKDTETHEYTSIVVTAPTCGKVGYTTYTCKCGSHTDDEVAALEHNYEAVVTAPTCAEQGYTTHTCTNCEDSYKNSYTDATGEHNFVDGKCTVCEQEEGHTHSYTSKVTAPTCVAQGYTTHTCSCGEEYVDSYVDATGEHNYVDGECSVCHAEDPNVPKVLATFTLGANGSASHSDGSGTSSYSETNNGYTLSLSNLANIYKNARDAKGNSCLKLGTGSKAGSFKFTVGSDVTKVIIYVAQYKANSATVTVNGTKTTINTASNNGAYTAIEIDTSTTKTVDFSVSSGYRVMINTIEFWG